MLTKDACQTLDSLFAKEDVVLVAPLNWGLGHAARCIPIIHHLKNHCREVIIASDGISLELLRNEFPGITYVTLPSYNIRYRFADIALNIACSAPGILSGIIREWLALHKIVKQKGITAILSDNRLGLTTKSTRNYYMTHQTRLVHPSKWVAKAGTWLHQLFIRRYHGCIIPDFESDNLALAPLLSHGPLPVNTYFIGPVTRISDTPATKEWDIVVLLSGPEPQRSRLEVALCHSLTPLRYLKMLVIRGSTKPNQTWPDNVTVENLAPTERIEKVLNACRLVIARPGYSTLMDIYSLPVSAIFIPTPGQTEQEYLASCHSGNPKYKVIDQNQINNIEKTIKSLI